MISSPKPSGKRLTLMVGMPQMKRVAVECYPCPKQKWGGETIAYKRSRRATSRTRRSGVHCSFLLAILHCLATLTILSRKIIYYISAMIDFRQSMARNRGAIDKLDLSAKFDKIPTVIAEGLLSRFTEVARESTKCVSVTVHPLRS